MIQPIKDKILVQFEEGDEMSAGGIVVPESFRGRSNKGKVIAVGNGTKEKKMDIPVNATVWVVKDWGTEVIDNGVSYHLVEQSAVLGYLPSNN